MVEQTNYLIDTDILIEFLRGKNFFIKEKINNLIKEKDYIKISVINLGELLVGAFKSENIPKNLFLVNQLKGYVDTLTVDEEVINLYGKAQAVLEKNGEMIGDFDVLIASTSIIHNLKLVTNNQKHFKTFKKYFPQLLLEEWKIK